MSPVTGCECPHWMHSWCNECRQAKVRELEADNARVDNNFIELEMHFEKQSQTIAQQAAAIDRLQRIANFYEWQSGICSICRGVKSTGHGMSCDYARKP